MKLLATPPRFQSALCTETPCLPGHGPVQCSTCLAGRMGSPTVRQDWSAHTRQRHADPSRVVRFQEHTPVMLGPLTRAVMSDVSHS